MPWRNGGVIGKRNLPDSGAASGIWRFSELESARREASWPTTGDALFASVVLLLRFEGSNDSTSFLDSSSAPKVVTANGNARISTAQSFFGGSSGFFDGTGDFLSTPAGPAFAFGTGDFTVETWLYVSSYNSQAVRFFTTSATVTNFSCEVTAAGALGFWNGSAFTTFGGSVTANVWHHIAICRASGVVRAFLNGALVGSATITTNLTNTLPIQFPATNSYASAVCYLNALRVTRAARYLAAFTRPTTVFPTN
jgi:hypothetical protein